MNEQELTEKHSSINEILFRLKVLLLIGNLIVKNYFHPTKKFTQNQKLINQPVIALSESELWNPHDNNDNWILTAGKIQNLRIATQKLNGLEIEANQIFSFWKHIGNPNLGQGYVVGREIREGCMVPTIAGGLCQLSNALYDAAIKANFEITERHKHTKVIKGSLAEQGRDATVKWNYIDLKFKSTNDFRIEAELNSDKLIVQFKSKQKNPNPTQSNLELSNSSKLNDCYSCGNRACIKHLQKKVKSQEISITTFILDEKWPEYDEYIQSIVNPNDHFIIPLKKNKFLPSSRYSWSALHSSHTSQSLFQGIYRAYKLRTVSKSKNNVFELMLQLDKKIATAATKKISIDSTHLVISQNLLPFIFETGALGGRTFDVLMTRLPFAKLHQRLDYAYSIHNESPTLRDFRASKYWVDLENKSLSLARKIISPHAEIAELYKNKIHKLPWQLPQNIPINTLGNKILFPASALGRKGAYEIKNLAKQLNLNLTVLGQSLEDPNFWGDFYVEQFKGDYKEIGLIVYPTFIENQPRQILKALSYGIPVITTTACGLEKQDNISIFNIEDIEGIKNEIEKKIDTAKCTSQSTNTSQIPTY